MIFRWMLCLIAINISIVYGPNCIYRLQHKDGDRVSQKLYKAGVKVTIKNENSFNRKKKRPGDCNSINSSMINPERLFMSFSGNKDGKFCCGEQIKNCRSSRYKNSTTDKGEKGGEFVERVLTSCANMTGYLYTIKCRPYIMGPDSISVEIHLESNKSSKWMEIYNCDSDLGLFTYWGQKIEIERHIPITVDVLNQQIYN
ncbi:hypothetical protein HZS_7618 [Henneguya salminicola]|nr:hypothetical protein HZS_7618 [Henneguya salminicola]